MRAAARNVAPGELATGWPDARFWQLLADVLMLGAADAGEIGPDWALWRLAAYIIGAPEPP